MAGAEAPRANQTEVEKKGAKAHNQSSQCMTPYNFMGVTQWHAQATSLNALCTSPQPTPTNKRKRQVSTQLIGSVSSVKVQSASSFTMPAYAQVVLQSL